MQIDHSERYGHNDYIINIIFFSIVHHYYFQVRGTLRKEWNRLRGQIGNANQPNVRIINICDVIK